MVIPGQYKKSDEPSVRRRRANLVCMSAQILIVAWLPAFLSSAARAATLLRPNGVTVYRDGRPAADFRLEAKDTGAVLKHADGKCAGDCDKYGARDVWTWEYRNKYYMHYDAAGDKGWMTALAVSDDMVHWEKRGAKLNLGAAGSDDSKCAAYGVPFFDGKAWQLFYLGSPNTSPAPDRIPSFPYLTLKAKADSPEGPWIKQYDVVPFRPQANSYYSATASPGYILPRNGGYLMFFSGSAKLRTLGIARTTDLDKPWTIDPNPILPPAEQIENTYLHYEKAYDTWFLFTNHVGLKDFEYTDAVWVYWTRDPEHWDPANKAVVMDPAICAWAKGAIGLPALLERNGRLGLYYDASPGESYSHMARDIGLAWLDLPLTPMYNYARPTGAAKPTMSASSTLGNFSLASLIDGDRTGKAWDNGGGWADATGNRDQDWVEIEFDKPKSIRQVNVFTLQDEYAKAAAPVTVVTAASQFGIEDFTVESWNGRSWQSVPGGVVIGNDKAWRRIDFAAILTSKLRVWVDKSRAGYSRLVELEAWGTPILGCTDDKAVGYNANAEIDDGSCATTANVGAAAERLGSITRVAGGFAVAMEGDGPYAGRIRDVRGRIVADFHGNGKEVVAWDRRGAYWIEVRKTGSSPLRRLLAF